MIVFPMAGLSRRFAEAGYHLPKYMLPAHGRSVFAHAVGGFSTYFAAEPFLFVLRDVEGSRNFVERECAALGIENPRIAVLDAPTRGQAETVAIGLERIAADRTAPLTIFNIDTFRPRFCYPPAPELACSDGYLEVFRGTGANWSYVRPLAGRRNRVAETAEKRPISDLCCTGLYHFSSAGIFLRHFSRYAARADGTELYVAPLYNLLIAEGADIRYHRIATDAVIFCGVPAEYEAFRQGPPPRR